MGHWLVVVGDDRYDAERLYHHDVLELDTEPGHRPRAGDAVALAAGDPPRVFGLGRVTAELPGDELDPDDPVAPERPAGGTVTVAYTHRMVDAPLPWRAEPTRPGQSGEPARCGRPRRLGEAEFSELLAAAEAQLAATPRRSWLVGVDLPIEATSPAEAVRQFWSYVTQLGPRELPAFVSPAEDELAMRAYVLGEESNLDPEEDE